MATYTLRRVLLLIPTLFGVVTITFLLMRVIPGDPARMVLGIEASPEEVARISDQLGLDESLWVQFSAFIGDLLQGDLGTSTRTGRPVTTEIGSRLPNTLQLAAISIVVALILGCTLGLLAALRPGSAIDTGVSTVSVLGVSVPVYLTGLLLILVFAVKLRWLPTAGNQHPLGWLMPALTMSLFAMGFIARQTRSAVLEVQSEDFVRTAAAKGAGRARVLLRHALRNALLPIVTVAGIQLGQMIGGAILTETVFSWPGIGRLLVEAIRARDFAIVQATVLVVAIGVVVINLVVDLLYTYIDPRVRYG